MQAILPNDLSEESLADLQVGESAWAVPWVIRVSSDGRMWIDLGFTLDRKRNYRDGTAQLLVERVDVNYWKATLYRRYTWRRGDPIPAALVPLNEFVS